MPLIKSASKEAFKENVKKEMDAGKPKDQSLAIAYNIRRKNRKPKDYAHGGEVENEMLHPKHEPEHFAEHLLHEDGIERLEKHEQDHDGLVPQAMQQMDMQRPSEEDKPEGMKGPDVLRIRKALMMAEGGVAPMREEAEELDANADRELAMKDSYPPGMNESDFQAQSEGEAKSPKEGFNTTGDSEEESIEDRAARRMLKALGRM